MRVKLVVNEPTLCSPTEKQISATERSVVRSSAAPARAAGEQVCVRRLAERTAELAAEMRAREARRASHGADVERLEVARVGERLGAQEVAGRRDEGHAYPR